MDIFSRTLRRLIERFGKVIADAQLALVINLVRVRDFGRDGGTLACDDNSTDAMGRWRHDLKLAETTACHSPRRKPPPIDYLR